MMNLEKLYGYSHRFHASMEKLMELSKDMGRPSPAVPLTELQTQTLKQMSEIFIHQAVWLTGMTEMVDVLSQDGDRAFLSEYIEEHLSHLLNK